MVCQQLQEQMALGRVAPDRLHRQPFAIHHRVVADDQLAPQADGLVGHVLGDVQGHQDMLHGLLRVPSSWPTLSQSMARSLGASWNSRDSISRTVGMAPLLSHRE